MNYNEFNKCKFCKKDLIPVGLDYLYDNIEPDEIEYERCSCDEAQKYWKNFDEVEYKNQRRKYFREVINKLYKRNFYEKRFQNMNFENFNINLNNELAVKIAKDYANKCITDEQTNGMIIIGESGVGKTHLAASIANKLIQNDKVVLMGRLNSLLDMIKETFYDNTRSEVELIELYSNVDMIIIDDLGMEKLSNWALEKLYTIVENRNEKELPIIITTRFDKEGLIERFKQNQDEQLADAIIEKLCQMCYGVILKNIKKELA